MATYWNKNFTEIVKDGAAGNQAYFAIFYKDGRGRFQRLYQAEGHEISRNPEKTTVNLIGQTAPKDIVKSFREEFSKDIVIEKGDPNYEFFVEFARAKHSGNNAVLDILMVDMMVDEAISGKKHRRYLAYYYRATTTVDTINYTDGKLSVSFSQATDPVQGIAQLVDDTEFPQFTPAADITITKMETSETAVSIETGKEKWVETSFSPLGCPYDFTVESSDERVCTVKRIRQSAVITGVGTGTADVTITPTADESMSETIEVTVS